MEPPTIVMGVDAGKSTGIAVVQFPAGEPPELLHCQQDSAKSHAWSAMDVLDVCRAYNPDVVVAEQFDLRPGNKFVADLSTVYINGALEYLEEFEPCIPKITWQTPGQAKGLVKDKVLKNLGFWVTGKRVHQKDADDVRDAMRHCVYYGAAHLEHLPTLRKGWPREQ